MLSAPQKTGRSRATSCLFNEKSPTGNLIVRLQSRNLNKRYWYSIGSSKGRGVRLQAKKSTETTGGVVIALDHSYALPVTIIVPRGNSSGGTVYSNIYW